MVETGKRKWTPPPGQREKVLAAALKLFDGQGYSAATIADIQLQSEVSIGSIYHHFGSKEGIAGDLYIRALRDFQRELLRALRASEGAEGGVKAAVAAHLRWVDANQARARFLMRREETAVVAVNRPDVTLLNRATFGEIEQWYRPLVEAEAIRELDLPILYAVWFGPAQEYARQMLERPHPRELLGAEPALAGAAWAALRPSR